MLLQTWYLLCQQKIAYRIWFCSRCCCRHKISQSSSISWRACSGVCMTSQSQHNVHSLVSSSAGWPICWIADTICLQIFYLLNSDVICSQNQICNRKNWLANFAARVKLYPYRSRPVGWYVLWYIPTTPSVCLRHHAPSLSQSNFYLRSLMNPCLQDIWRYLYVVLQYIHTTTKSLRVKNHLKHWIQCLTYLPYLNHYCYSESAEAPLIDPSVCYNFVTGSTVKAPIDKKL